MLLEDSKSAIAIPFVLRTHTNAVYLFCDLHISGTVSTYSSLCCHLCAAATGQQFYDPEQSPSARSAPELDNNLAPLGSSSSSAAVPPHSSRAVSAPALGAGDKLQSVAQIDELTPAQKRTLAHVMLLSKVMDNAITIPIIKKKFGLDAMLGLIPYVGELL
jgi:hypothetical protein